MERSFYLRVTASEIKLEKRSAVLQQWPLPASVQTGKDTHSETYFYMQHMYFKYPSRKPQDYSELDIMARLDWGTLASISGTEG